MKVAMICDVMGQPNNGTTLAALNLIRYLRDAGHTVTVVAPGGEASVGYLPVRVWLAGPLIDRILRMNGVELAVPDKQLLEAVIREADVVHLLIPLPLARAALKIARRLGKPVTASFHCQAENITAHLGMMNAGWLNRLIYRNFYRKVYRWCTAVHYPTEFIREVFETATHPTPALCSITWWELARRCPCWTRHSPERTPRGCWDVPTLCAPRRCIDRRV